MAAYELLADHWDEPDVESETGYVRHLRGDVFEVPDKHLDRLLRIGALVPVDDEVAEPDNAENADEDTSEEVSVPAGDSGNDDSGDAGSESNSAVAEKVADSNATPAADGEAPAPVDVAPASDLERPKQTAVKDVWVDYAVARGMDRVDAESLDKRELIAELS